MTTARRRSFSSPPRTVLVAAEARRSIIDAAPRFRGPSTIAIGLALDDAGAVRFVIGTGAATLGIAVASDDLLAFVDLPSPDPIARFVLRGSYIHLR